MKTVPNINKRLTLVLWGATLFAFVLVGAGLMLYQRYTLEDRALQIMEPYARLVSVGADAAVAFEDSPRAQEILDTLRSNPQILGAVIYLADGRVLASFSRQPGLRPGPVPRHADGVYVGADRVELLQELPRGARLGLSMGLEQIKAQTRQTAWLFGVGVLILLVVTYAQMAVLRRMIARPIATLTEATERVRGAADYSHRVPATGEDEVGRLGQNFNAMLEAIHEREEDLRRLGQLQRTIVDNAAYGIISTTPEGLVSSFNPAAERLLGYSAQEIVGKRTPECWHDAGEVADYAEQLSDSFGVPVQAGFEVFTIRPDHGLPEEREWTFIRKDGQRVPVSLSVTALRGAEGDTSGYVGLISDLTERKQAEAERQTNLHHFESMDRINRAMQSTQDVAGAMTAVLGVVLEIFNCDRVFLLYPCDPDAEYWTVPFESCRPEYPGVADLGMKVPMDPEVAQTFRLLLETDGPVKFGPGSPYPLPAGVSEAFGFKSLMSAAVRPKPGLAWQFGIHQCSHARIWTQEEERLFREIGRRLADGLSTLLAYRDLQDNRSKLEEAQRIAHIGYWDRDFVADRITLSDECSRIFGLSSQGLTMNLAQWHERWLELIHPDERDQIAQAAAEALRGGNAYNVEYRVIRPGGEVRFVHSEATVTRDESGRPRRMLGMMQDITERKLAEDEIRQLNQQLEQRVAERTAQLEEANQELEAFAYSVSHDLRTPLRAIDGFTHILLEEHLGKLNEEGRRLLSLVSDNALRMAQLIDDMLKFSRTGRTELTFSQVDMEQLAQAVAAELMSGGDGKAQIEIGALPPARGDIAMLRQVFVNLLSNAIKFSRTRETPRIAVGATVDGGEIVYHVRDNGVGFSMEYADRLFGVFQRLHGADEFEGTGIGLAIVKRIIARHGGRVWAEGKVGMGATFYFALPVKESIHE